MTPTDYDAFVQKTNQFASKNSIEQRSIALYGLVGEIGSLVAAVKKKLLSEGGEQDASWDQPNDEIKEELGDALWYCYATAHILNKGYFDLLSADITTLQGEIGRGDERAQRIAAALKPENREAFLEAAPAFLPTQRRTFDDYQTLAFRTARTEGKVLLEVCLALLWQLGAELLRVTLPEIELALNKNIADRPANTVLCEIVWHLSALASLYHLTLDEVVDANCEKVAFRSIRDTPTPMHDDDRGSKEQFPRAFDVTFARIGPGKSRMYFSGRPLGDDLTDNFHEDDGYRFHDVIHLALIAHLGWSPVIRGLMKRKRKSRNDRVDEVEDGGRAQVVEELVIKAIHTEGNKLAKACGRCPIDAPLRLFPDRTLIPFKLLKTLRAYVDGLEVQKNTFWEWENVIFDGCELFFRLCAEKQGTVQVDLDKRTIKFSPEVAPGVQGITVGLGMGTASLQSITNGALSEREQAWATECNRMLETVAAKRALLNALGMNHDAPEFWSEIEVRLGRGNTTYVRAAGSVQQRAWELKAVDYKVAFSRSADDVICTATAIADVRDLAL